MLAAACVALLLALAGFLLTAPTSAAAPPDSSYPDRVLSDHPGGYWRLGEASGTVALDQTKDDLDGSYENGVTLGAAGAISDGDPAATLDGVDDRISMGDPPGGPLDFGSGDFTFEGWIRTTVNQERVIVSKQKFLGPYWQVTVTDDYSAAGTIRARISDGSALHQAYGPTVHVDDGAWHHVAVVFDRSNGMTIYVDKVFSRHTPGVLAGDVDNSASLLVGGRTIDSYPPFHGDMDEVAVYPDDLSSSAIADHYDAAIAGDEAPPSVSIATPVQSVSVADETPSIAGSAGMAVGDEAQVTLRLYGGSLASGPALQTLGAVRDVTGSWAADATPALPPGTYTAQAEQSDAAGNAGLSAPVSFDVSVPPPHSPTDPVLVAAGDIADCGSSGDEATAALLDDIPGTVATLGDNAYPSGRDADFADCYDPTWGRHKSRTRPTPGDHDYETPGAAGYFRYFGAAAGDPSKGYYSYDLGAWHIVVLNPNCLEVGGCHAGSAEEQWLRSDLAAHPSGCTLSLLGSPLFSSNSRVGGNVLMKDLWQALHDHGADVVLSADEHDYERFAPQDPTGKLDLANGITEIVVGTGGASHYAFPAGVPTANSQVRNGDTFGVIKLTLHPDSYEWDFVPVAGKTFTDSGSRACHRPQAGGSDFPEQSSGAAAASPTGSPAVRRQRRSLVKASVRRVQAGTTVTARLTLPRPRSTVRATLLASGRPFHSKGQVVVGRSVLHRRHSGPARLKIRLTGRAKLVLGLRGRLRLVLRVLVQANGDSVVLRRHVVLRPRG